MTFLWRLLILCYDLAGQDARWTLWVNYKGFRRAAGGRWGLWESDYHPGGSFRIWVVSPCPHYPPPPLVNSTEPLATEDYTGPVCELV